MSDQVFGYGFAIKLITLSPKNFLNCCALRSLRYNGKAIKVNGFMETPRIKVN